MQKEHKRMNRRAFARSAAAAAGLLGTSLLSLAEKAEADLKIGLYSITYLGVWYRGDALALEQVIDRAKKFGYDGVEIDGSGRMAIRSTYRSGSAATFAGMPRAGASTSTR